MPLRFSYADLKLATGNFKVKLGGQEEDLVLLLKEIISMERKLQ